MSRYRGVAYIFALVILGKVTGFGKDLIFTFYHGVSRITDAYFLATSISSVVYMAIYSAIPLLMVPLYTKALTEPRRILSSKLSAAAGFFVVISACVTFLVFVAADFFVNAFSGNIDSQVNDLATLFLSIMALTFVLSTLVSIFNSLQTVNRVVIPSYVVPVVNNIVFCGGLFFFSSPDDFYLVLILGILAWLILMVFNLLIIRRYFTFRIKSAVDFFTDRKFIVIFLPAIFSFYIEQINNFVSVYFATELGLGAISVFAYANKLNFIFLSVFLVYLTASLFPRIAAVAARNDQSELASYLVSCVRIVIICSLPIVLYMNYYSHEIVALLFQRGKFLSADVANVASVFSIVLLAIPLCLIRDIMNRVFFSHGNTLTPVFLSLGALLINASICALFFRQYGLMALALAIVLSTLVNCIIAILWVQRNSSSVIFAAAIKVLFVCGVGAAVSYMVLLALDSIVASYWLFIFIPYAICYFICLKVLKVAEIEFVVQRLGSVLLKR